MPAVNTTAEDAFPACLQPILSPVCKAHSGYSPSPSFPKLLEEMNSLFKGQPGVGTTAIVWAPAEDGDQM